MRRQLILPLALLCLLMAAALRLPDLAVVPPGLHFDEAANGLLAGEIGLEGQRPIFITSYTGKEPLFFYFAGAIMRFLGVSIFTLRLAAALLGLLTVAATFTLGVELTSDRRVALLAAGLLAVSFWHLLFSRLGFRAVSQPLMASLAVIGIWRGLRRGSRAFLLAGGLALGLTAYTYLAARLFPIPLILALTPLLIGRGADAGRRRQDIVLVGLTSLITAAPLLAYFAANPDAFWVRIDQVLPDAATPSLGQSYLKTLGMFFVEGDPYIRFNIPGQTLLGWFLGGLAVVGWFLALLRWFRAGEPIRKSASLLLVLIPPLMLLPTALAVGEIVPSNLRAIGLLPFLYLLPAIAMFAALDRAREWLARDDLLQIRLIASPKLAPVIILLILGVGGVVTGRRYFVDWATRPDLYYEADGDLVAAATYLDGLERTAEPLYMSALYYRHPTTAFLSQRYEDIKWLPASEAVAFPETGPAMYIFPQNSPRPDWVTALLPDESQFAVAEGRNGSPDFVAYRLDEPPDLVPEVVVNAQFEDVATLLGYRFGVLTRDALNLEIFWQIDRRPATDVVPFVHLEDSWGHRWGQVERAAYPSEQWTPGERVLQVLSVPLQPGLPPGNYRLLVGLFDPDSGRQLARLDRNGRYAGSALTIEAIPLANTTLPEKPPHPPLALDLPAGPSLQLLGYERREQNVDSGSRFWLSLWWQSSTSLDSMTARLELIGADQTAFILSTAQPVHDSYPFSEWTGSQLVIDHQTPQVPVRFPAGKYALRLRLMAADDSTVMTANLGDLTIEASDRNFSPPPVEFPLDALLGDKIALSGYDLVPRGAGAFDLSLVWQRKAAIAERYTVFVHVLNEDGTCCLWQADTWPGGGLRPTDDWLNGEVVIDDYAIQLPPDTTAGSYPLEVGMYIAENGRRLLVEMRGLRPSDALILRPLVVE